MTPGGVIWRGLKTINQWQVGIEKNSPTTWTLGYIDVRWNMGKLGGFIFFQVKPLDCESPCVNVSTYFQPFQRSICCKYGSLMSRKFPLTKLVGYPKTNRSFSIIENKRLWDILILSLQFVMPEDENWKISIKGTSPPSIPLLSPIIFQMFNVWSNVAIFLICQWPYSYMNVWANVCIYIYISI